MSIPVFIINGGIAVGRKLIEYAGEKGLDWGTGYAWKVVKEEAFGNKICGKLYNIVEKSVLDTLVGDKTNLKVLNKRERERISSSESYAVACEIVYKSMVEFGFVDKTAYQSVESALFRDSVRISTLENLNEKLNEEICQDENSELYKYLMRISINNVGREKQNDTISHSVEEFSETFNIFYNAPKELKIIHSNLNPTSYGHLEMELLQRDFVGRKWLLEKLLKWKDDSKSSPIFVIYGVPGAGKSTFAANLVSTCNEVVAGVFFKYDRRELKDPDEVVRLLAYQLATKLSDYRGFLQQVLEDNMWQKYHGGALFDELILYPLNACTDNSRETCLAVFDALDEIPDKDDQLVHLLLDKLERLPRWIKIVVTLRPETGVSSMVTIGDSVMLDAQNPENESDIIHYLERKLRKTKENQTFETQEDEMLISRFLAHEVLLELARICEGSFLYAAYLCDAIIRREIDPSHLGTYPSGIRNFYRQNFHRVFSDTERKKRFWKGMELLVASGSLPVKIFCGVTGFSVYDYREFFNCFVGMLKEREHSFYYTDRKQKEIAFVHKSIADYLCSEEAGKYYVDRKCGLASLGTYYLDKIRKNRKIVSKPQRYSLPAPIIDVDLELDYMQNHLAQTLLDAEMYDDYRSFLMEEETPLDVYWEAIDLLPLGYDIDTLLTRFYKYFEDFCKGISYGLFNNVAKLPKIFFVLSSTIKTQRVAEVFFNIVTGFDFPAFFRSEVSDAYNHRGVPYLFNADKIDAAYYMRKCIDICEEHAIAIPEGIRDLVDRTKLSAFYIEGAFSEKNEYSIYYSFPFLFRGDIIRMDEKTYQRWKDVFSGMDLVKSVAIYNTCALLDHLCRIYDVANLNEAYISQLVIYGGDPVEASQKAEKETSRENKQHSHPIASLRNHNNVLQHVRNKYGRNGRMHTQEAKYVKTLGAIEAYCTVYQYPCCNKYAVIEDGVPSRYQDNGCVPTSFSD